MRLPTARRTIGHAENTSRIPRLRASDRSVATDVLVREEPEEDEEDHDEEEDEDEGKDEDGEGYSE